MRYLIRGKFTAGALKRIQQQGAVDRVERAKERFRLMGAEIQQAYFVPTTGGLELIGIVEAEEEALASILFAINDNGHIEEEAVRIMTPEEMDKVIERSRSVPLPIHRITNARRAHKRSTMALAEKSNAVVSTLALRIAQAAHHHRFSLSSVRVRPLSSQAMCK